MNSYFWDYEGPKVKIVSLYLMTAPKRHAKSSGRDSKITSKIRMLDPIVRTVSL